ncbi:MAG: hypothetical protein LBF08_02585 [Dysgonamonadaceae bacterium]|jgi:hypothetical protein|nr:hypothetical protein [Dysgonamonadaceae bacterium]
MSRNRKVVALLKLAKIYPDTRLMIVTFNEDKIIAEQEQNRSCSDLEVSVLQQYITSFQIIAAVTSEKVRRHCGRSEAKTRNPLQIAARFSEDPASSAE